MRMLLATLLMFVFSAGSSAMAADKVKGRFDLFLNGVEKGYEKYKIITRGKKDLVTMQSEVRVKIPWPKAKRNYVDLALYPMLEYSLSGDEFLGYEYRLNINDHTNMDLMEAEDSATEYYDQDKLMLDPFDAQSQRTEDELRGRVRIGVNSGALIRHGNTLHFKRVTQGMESVKDEPYPGEFFVIDAYTFVPYVRLAEKAAEMKGSSMEITVVMPQGMRLLDGIVEHRGARTTYFRDRNLILNHYDLMVDGVLIGSFWVDKARQLVQIIVPNEGLTASLSKYDPVPFDEEKGPEVSRDRVILAAELEETEVRIPSDGIQIGGSLVTPKGEGPFPAVLLVQDLGSTNRDGDPEGRGGRTGFVRQLAYFLADEGFASLRTDARGVGISGGSGREVYLEDRVADAANLLRWLKQHPETRSGDTVILTYGIGGWIGALAAKKEVPAGFIAVSYPAKELFRLWKEQAGLIEDPGRRRETYSEQEKVIELADTEQTWADYMGGQIFLPEVRALREIDPIRLAGSLSAPCLFAYPTRDRVVMAYHAEVLKPNLLPHQKIREIDGADHSLVRQDGEKRSGGRLLDRESLGGVIAWLRTTLETQR